jgi:hypothetical protein
MPEYILVALGGAVGALIKIIVKDNELILPKKINGKLSLGFLGAILLGAFVGYAIDGSFITAAMAGFTGFAVIENLVPLKSPEKIVIPEAIESIIRIIAGDECVDQDLAVAVAKCESSLNPKAINTNTDGSRDRGLFQINEKWHPEISDEQAFNIETSTRFFCKAFKAGHLDWWNATKSCWGLDK